MMKFQKMEIMFCEQRKTELSFIHFVPFILKCIKTVFSLSFMIRDFKALISFHLNYRLFIFAQDLGNFSYIFSLLFELFYIYFVQFTENYLNIVFSLTFDIIF